MAKTNVTIDSKQIESLFDTLNPERQKQIMMKALRKGGEYLKEKTQETLAAKFPKSKTAKGKADKPMYEGVYIKPNKHYTEVDVSVMGNYLNIFFESGTDERYRKVRYTDSRGKKRVSKTQKGGYTGKLEPLNFFRDTREREVTNVVKKIEEAISKEIISINKEGK